MKLPLRIFVVVASVLLISLGLSNCSSGGHTVPFAKATTAFAYIQDTSTAPAPTIAHSLAERARSREMLRSVPRLATGRFANTSIDLGTGKTDIYVMDTFTGSNTKIASGGAFLNVQLSADGTKLLACARDSSGYAQIYVADEKFQTVTQLTTDKTEHFDASFSADGTMITFDNDNDEIFTIPTAGGVATRVLTTGVNAWGPVFTPDGKKILFTGNSGMHDYIYSVNLDGTGLTQLSNGTNWDGMPAVSPDGTEIAFERDGNETEDIAVIGIGGETTANPAKVLTTNGKSWQPQYLGNSKILYLSWQNSTRFIDQIYEMNADGTDVAQLTNNTMENCFNWWYWD